MAYKRTLISLGLMVALFVAGNLVDCAIIDITHEYTENLPLFDSKKSLGQILKLVSDQRQGSLTTSSMLTIEVHSGTHVDAPSHTYISYLNEGVDATTLDLQTLNGPAIVVDVPRNKNISADALKSLNIPRGVKRVLFRTLNTDRKLMNKPEFDASYVGFTADGAQFLVDNTDVKLVGVDYLSVGHHENVLAPHRILMKDRRVIPVEGLKLDEPQANVVHTLHCLPLRIHADASPVRCALIK